MERNERIEKLPSALLPWYARCARALPWREDPSPYHVWISEIMLQQTRIEAVKPYYARFLQEIPDIASLAAADSEHLQKLWEGLGYYSRVRNLHAAALQIMEKHNGQFPQEFSEIRALRGIGEYTAGAIGSICFNLPTPAVDGNVLRVLARITGDRRPVTDEKTKAAVRAELAAVYPAGHCGEFTQALMELGEIVCIPGGAPGCDACPCREFCVSRDGGWMNLPVKTEKKARREEQLTVFILHCGGFTAIRKRENTGLLAGLWELPNVPGTLTEEEALLQAQRWGCEPEALEGQSHGKHVFTHVEWNMQCYTLFCRKMPAEFVWAEAEEFRDSIALPTAFRKLLPPIIR